MNKIDLIIDALEESLKNYATDQYGWHYHPCCGAYLSGHTDDCKSKNALAAARELKALEPEWWVNPDDGSMVSQFSMTHCADTLKDKYTIPLYALDEVTK
jgi:hypothetical protein